MVTTTMKAVMVTMIAPLMMRTMTKTTMTVMTKTVMVFATIMAEENLSPIKIFISMILLPLSKKSGNKANEVEG